MGASSSTADSASASTSTAASTSAAANPNNKFYQVFINLVLDLLDKVVKYLSELVPRPNPASTSTSTSASTAASASASTSTSTSASTAASTSTSASTSAAANPNDRTYQVFINHRGVDVKKTFARSLYLRLLEKGLTAFLDQEEMQQGHEISSQITDAIKTASFHVAIFSPRYAESDWCLNELLLMLKSKAHIIPVFYRVSPAYVRWMQGLYGEALRKHEKKGRYDSNTIEEWRNALQQVSNNSGFELERCNGEELVLDLLDKVVKCLSETVTKPELYVAQYPTGLDDKLTNFEDTVLLQQQQSGKPQILGIVGLGGVGKTTLAKKFFNRKKSDYNKSCFLSDVREHAANRSLNLLQSQLLTSLIGSHKQVNSVDEGKGWLIEALKSSKSLIILDDVDDVNQVRAFLPETDHLNSRSLILITSRDRNVLRLSKVENSSIYSLSGLNKQQSMELFCSHAFSQAYPFMKRLSRDRFDATHYTIDVYSINMNMYCYTIWLQYGYKTLPTPITVNYLNN